MSEDWSLEQLREHLARRDAELVALKGTVADQARELEQLRDVKQEHETLLYLIAVWDCSCDCGRDSTCFAAYDHHENPGPHCDYCCDHSQEGGRCIRIPELIDEEQIAGAEPEKELN